MFVKTIVLSAGVNVNIVLDLSLKSVFLLCLSTEGSQLICQ